MNPVPTFAIVIPSHNRKDLLLEAVASVQAQTIPDWELIIIDDAYTESLADTLSSDELQDDRIAIVRNDERKGVGASRNLGIERSQGRWLVFLDDDDVLQPCFLEAAKQLLPGLQSREALSMHSKMHPQSTRGSWEYHNMKLRLAENRRIGTRNLENFYRLVESPPQISTIICPRELLGSNRFPEDRQYGEDLLLWAALLTDGITFRKLCKDDECPVMIRQHGSQQLSRGTDEQIFDYFLELSARFNLDEHTLSCIRAKKVLRAILRGRLDTGSWEFLKGIKKPRHFLGSLFYQIGFKSKVIISYATYQLMKIDL